MVAAKPTPPKPEPTETPAEPAVDTASQDRIKELEDQLARALAKQEVEQEEREAREAERASNQRFTLSADGSAKQLDPTDPGLSKEGNILIHFIDEGGFTAFEKVWVRGEELEIEPGSPEHEFTKDKYGNSWLDLSEGDQYEKYGKIIFRPGPWKGKSLAQSKFERLAALASEEGFDIPSAGELAAAEKASRLKGRKPPRVSAH